MLEGNFFLPVFGLPFFASVVLLISIIYYCIVEYLLNETLLK